MAETYLKGKPVIISFKGASDKMPPQKRIGKAKSRMVAIPEFSTQFATQHDLQQEEDLYCKLYKHLQALRQRVSGIILLLIAGLMGVDCTDGGGRR